MYNIIWGAAGRVTIAFNGAHHPQQADILFRFKNATTPLHVRLVGLGTGAVYAGGLQSE